MPALHVNRFLGIAPKLGPQLLPAENAQVAKDAKLWSEKLRPVSGIGLPEALTKTTGDIQTIYRFNSNLTWLHWTQGVNVVRGPIANDTLEKTYFTGTDKPRVTTNVLFDDGTPGTSLPPASYILGIPAPDSAPVASDNGAGNITGTVDYVFTFVRKWSDGTVDEGPPSPVSNQLTLSARQTSVTLPNSPIAASYADYGITHKRLYRLNGGTRFYVSEVTIGTSPTTDNIAATALGGAITSTNYLPCPDGMVGLIALPNGVMAGFKDNVVYLSEPYRPWAYPLANQYVMNWPIVALGSVGTSVIVVTRAYPSIGRGVDPAAYSFKRDPGSFPCISKRSVASSELGVLWATPAGIALCDGADVTLATKSFMTRDEWQRDFAPSTLHAVVYDGRYYGWFTNSTAPDGTKLGGGLILDWAERAFLSSLGNYVYAAYPIPDTEELWIAKRNPLKANTNYVFKWEADPATPFAYEWKSKKFVIPGLENFGWVQVIADYGAGLSPSQIAAVQAQIAAVQAFNGTQGDTDGPINGNGLNPGGFEINGGPMGGDNVLQIAPSTSYVVGAVSFKYWVDGVLKKEVDITDNNPVPLPSGFMGETHEFQVSGAVETTQVSLATSAEELASV